MNDIENKVTKNDNKSLVLQNSKFIVRSDNITIYGIRTDRLPTVQYTLLINGAFKIWHDNEIFPLTRFDHITKCKEFLYFNEILQIMEFLNN